MAPSSKFLCVRVGQNKNKIKTKCRVLPFSQENLPLPRDEVGVLRVQPWLARQCFSWQLFWSHARLPGGRSGDVRCSRGCRPGPRSGGRGGNQDRCTRAAPRLPRSLRSAHSLSSAVYGQNAEGAGTGRRHFSPRCLPRSSYFFRQTGPGIAQSATPRGHTPGRSHL